MNPRHGQPTPSARELVTPELHADALWLLDVCGQRGMNVQRMLRAFVGVEVMVEEALRKTRNARQARPREAKT